MQQSAAPAPTTTTRPAPKTAQKTLHCSTHVGALARVDFKLSPSVATGIRATAIQPSAASPGTIRTADIDSFILKSKVELSGDYNGCPHCGKVTICHCRYCGVISCATGTGERHRCPSCQRTFPTVPLTDPIDLTGNRERPPQPTMAATPRTSLPRRTTKALPQHPKGLLPRK
ncbi:MAG: hypothetical protein N0C86_12515 [Candidatus Thiodiazotropha taylori]|nr:hypothetical protein [Candidatus Thiodiazotropha taylori]MCW4326810.1 hypothetical protein [Candidatus Thiodiazotropha taylori]